MVSSSSNGAATVRQRGNHSPLVHHPPSSLDPPSSDVESDKVHGRRLPSSRRILSMSVPVLVGGLCVAAVLLYLAGPWASSSALDGGRRRRGSRQPAARVPARHFRDRVRDAGGGKRRRDAWLGDGDGADGRAGRNARVRRWSSPRRDGRMKSWTGRSPAGSDDESSAGSNTREEAETEVEEESEAEAEEMGWMAVERLGERRPRVLLLQFEDPSGDILAGRSVTGDDNRSGGGSGSGNGSGSGSGSAQDSSYLVNGPDPRFVSYRDRLLLRTRRLPVHADATPSFSSDDDDGSQKRHEDAKKSKKYGRTLREPLETEECRPKHDWQRGSFPNCNILHEHELGQLSGMYGRAARKRRDRRAGDGEERVKLIANGYWRDVWLLNKAAARFPLDVDEEITVLKTLRYRHDFTDRNYDRHRKDALASERLSGSEHVVDIFAYCANSAVFEYGPGGDIDKRLWPYDRKEKEHYVADIPSVEKLNMAYQVAAGIAAVHSVEDDGYASIAHTDITPSQFIFINNKWKLNDFNRCRFMRVYKDEESPCGFYVGANPGKFRAPEEYEFREENEMVDVYSMGNVFYAILAGEMPFQKTKESKAQKMVMEGKRPEFPDFVLESRDIAIQAVLAAAKKCWAQEPENRPAAAAVRDNLKKVLDRITRRKIANKVARGSRNSWSN